MINEHEIISLAQTLIQNPKIRLVDIKGYQLLQLQINNQQLYNISIDELLNKQIQDEQVESFMMLTQADQTCYWNDEFVVINNNTVQIADDQLNLKHHVENVLILNNNLYVLSHKIVYQVEKVSIIEIVEEIIRNNQAIATKQLSSSINELDQIIQHEQDYQKIIQINSLKIVLLLSQNQFAIACKSYLTYEIVDLYNIIVILMRYNKIQLDKQQDILKQNNIGIQNWLDNIFSRTKQYYDDQNIDILELLNLENQMQQEYQNNYFDNLTQYIQDRLYSSQVTTYCETQDESQKTQTVSTLKQETQTTYYDERISSVAFLLLVIFYREQSNIIQIEQILGNCRSQSNICQLTKQLIFSNMNVISQGKELYKLDDNLLVLLLTILSTQQFDIGYQGAQILYDHIIDQNKQELYLQILIKMNKTVLLEQLLQKQQNSQFLGYKLYALYYNNSMKNSVQLLIQQPVSQNYINLAIIYLPILLQNIQLNQLELKQLLNKCALFSTQDTNITYKQQVLLTPITQIIQNEFYMQLDNEQINQLKNIYSIQLLYKIYNNLEFNENEVYNPDNIQTNQYKLLIKILIAQISIQILLISDQKELNKQNIKYIIEMLNIDYSKINAKEENKLQNKIQNAQLLQKLIVQIKSQQIKEIYDIIILIQSFFDLNDNQQIIQYVQLIIPLIFTNSKEFQQIYHNLTLKLFNKKALYINKEKSNQYVLNQIKSLQMWQEYEKIEQKVDMYTYEVFLLSLQQLSIYQQVQILRLFLQQLNISTQTFIISQQNQEIILNRLIQQNNQIEAVQYLSVIDFIINFSENLKLNEEMKNFLKKLIFENQKDLKFKAFEEFQVTQQYEQLKKQLYDMKQQNIPCNSTTICNICKKPIFRLIEESNIVAVFTDEQNQLYHESCYENK